MTTSFSARCPLARALRDRRCSASTSERGGNVPFRGLAAPFRAPLILVPPCQNKTPASGASVSTRRTTAPRPAAQVLDSRRRVLRAFGFPGLAALLAEPGELIRP